MTYWRLLLLLFSTPVLPTFTSPVDVSCISRSVCARPVKQFNFLLLNSQDVVSGGQI